MAQTLAPHSRSRRIIISSLLLLLQSLSLLILAVLTAFLGISAAGNAAARHKATAAALSIGVAVLGGGLFLSLGFLVLLLAWGMWRQKGWAFCSSAILEGLSLLICLALLSGGINWLLLSEAGVAVAILVCLFTTRQR